MIGINSANSCAPNYSIWVQEQKVLYGFGNGSNWYKAISDSVLTLNDWNHLAVTFDGTNYILYVNGEQVHNYTGAAGQIPVSQPMRWIGQVNSYFQGQIDEVRIWDDARTADEIQDYMSKNLTGEENGLVAYYDFENNSTSEDNSISRTIDRTGNGNGTLKNGPTWGVKFEVIFLLNFHPVFITVILCRVGKRAAGSQNRMTINIARLPTGCQLGRGFWWASGRYDLDMILRTSARLPTLPLKKTEQN
jgi:hypothetical protein